MEQEVCDVAGDAPPNKENPLPEFGELFLKRELKKAKAGGSGDEGYQQKKKECKAQPLKDKCIPKQILLPFKLVPETAGRYVEFFGHTGTSRTQKAKVNFPGWLIELSDAQLQSAIDCKELLASGEGLCELINPVFNCLSGLGAALSEEDVVEILRRVPSVSGGPSFSHFMFIAGNPSYAKKKGVFQEASKFDVKADCVQEDEEEDTTKPKPKEKKKNVVQRLYQIPKVADQDDWPPEQDKKGSGDKSKKEYSLNEKLFYSALLYTEMYETMETIHKIYSEGVSVPESKAKTLKLAQQTGFGASDIGFKKLGFAEWDRPLPPLPKTSPYLADLALVSKRLRIMQPNGPNAMYKRSKTSFQPLFLTVKAPRTDAAPITVAEDSKRLKGILQLLASQGNCLAMLPDVQFILHLSDTLLAKLEQVNRQAGPIPSKVSNRAEELELLKKEGNNLNRPHGILREIVEMPTLIKYMDAIKLREICAQIREQHWAYICEIKSQFREIAWKLMHVDRIPCGNLRESFVYSFQIYLPEKSHLPIVHDSGA